jgi:hypothetical protein
MEKDGSNVRLINNDPNYNEYDPVVVAPHSRPQVIPTDPNVAAGIASGKTTGMFFDGDVYARSTTDGHLRPSAAFTNDDGSTGEVKYVRVLAAVPLPRNGNTRGGPIGNTDFEKQRVVGYAPVRSDGSFAIEVPANTSLHVQTLDQYGMSLVNQLTWIQVMPGEHRLCTGCHDTHDHDKVINDFQILPSLQVFNKAQGTTYDAGFNNADNVMASANARTDTMDFFDRSHTGRANTVQAVFDSRCISCHGTSAPAGGLSLQLQSSDMLPVPASSNMSGTTTVYDTLTSAEKYRTPNGSRINEVTDQGARFSPLMWVMYNRELDDPGGRNFRVPSYDHAQLWATDSHGSINPFLPANRDLLTIIEWIDAGTQFSNSTSP